MARTPEVVVVGVVSVLLLTSYLLLIEGKHSLLQWKDQQQVEGHKLPDERDHVHHECIRQNFRCWRNGARIGSNH